MAKIQKEIILQMLKEAGSAGVNTAEICQKTFIPNYTGRISDLRKDGHNIEDMPVPGKNYARYVLHANV